MAGHSLSDKLEFGKYKGLSIAEVAKRNPFYLDWCIRNVNHFWLYSKTFSSVLNISRESFYFTKEACKKNYAKLAKGNRRSASKRTQSISQDWSRKKGEDANWDYDRYNPAHDSDQNIWIDVLGAGEEAETAYWNTE